MIRRNPVLLKILAVIAYLLAPFECLTAQSLMSPNSSLDIQVPAAPIPVKIGGRTHLVYELHITNFRKVNLTLTRVEVLDSARTNTVLLAYENSELISALAAAGARADQPDNLISSGQRVILFVWLALDNNAPVPSALGHRISFRVATSSAEEIGAVQVVPIKLRSEAPVVLSPPLRGGPWAAIYDPSLNGGHRRALFAIDGRARIPARFAIDWIKLGPDGRPSQGDPSVMSNSYGYNADVLAVADGLVAALEDGFPEPTPRTSFDRDAGNYVALDLGGGRFAFYEHLKPGSIRVKIGERVRSGQLLASLGGSGSISSGPHLHFHVADANSPLGAEGLPFVFNSFERLGAYESLNDFASGRAWIPGPEEIAKKQTMEMPSMLTVVRFR